jgi:hypothetical protein
VAFEKVITVGPYVKQINAWFPMLKERAKVEVHFRAISMIERKREKL